MIVNTTMMIIPTTKALMEPKRPDVIADIPELLIKPAKKETTTLTNRNTTEANNVHTARNFPKETGSMLVSLSFRIIM